MSETSPFAEWLARTGRALGYKTNTSLARALGVPQPTVSRWKSGSKPSVEHLVKISDLFGVELALLLALAGYVSSTPVSPDDVRPSVTRAKADKMIDAANVTGQQKELLRQFWLHRLEEEEDRLREVIGFVEDARDYGSIPEGVAQAGLEAQSRTAAPRHFQALVSELQETLAAVSASDEFFESGQEVRPGVFVAPDGAEMTPRVVGLQLREFRDVNDEQDQSWRVVLTGLGGQPVMWTRKLRLADAKRKASKMIQEAFNGQVIIDDPEEEGQS